MGAIRISILFLLLSISLGTVAQETDFTLPERLPDFMSGSFSDFVKKNLVYPEEAESENVEGKVLVKVLVSTLGQIENAEIIRSLGYGCDEEALRIAELSSGLWSPAADDGKSVPVIIHLPILFNLPEESTSEKGKVTQTPVESEKVDRAVILFGHGTKNFDEEKYGKAKHYFEQVLELKPEDSNARFNLGLTKIKLDDKEGACADFRLLSDQGNEEALKMLDKHCP